MIDSHQHVIELPRKLPRQEVMRMMGARRAKTLAGRVEAVLDRLMAEATDLIHPRGVYAVHAVEQMTDTRIELAGCPPVEGPIAGFMRPARRMAAFVVSIGPDIERISREMFSRGDMLEGFVLDAIGSASADAASESLAEHLRQEVSPQGDSVTLPFSPGYCGMGLDQQRAIFGIVDGEAVGVTLGESMLMTPIKSVSGLLGIGPREEVTAHGSPCRYCELTECSMRRE